VVSQFSLPRRGVHRLINTDEGFDPQKQVHIFWEGTQFATTSFSIINRNLCSGIIDSGVAELTTVPYEPDQFVVEGNPGFERLAAHDIRVKGLSIRNRSKRPHVWVRHQWPLRRNPPGKAKWIIMHPWEYSAIPGSYADIFSLADEIWTPTNFSRDAFVLSGIDPSKVHVVPNGMDPEVFTPSGEPLILQTTKRFKFLFVGGTIYRKGVDILLESYSRAFTSEDDVCLVIKDLGVNTIYKGQTTQDLIKSYGKAEGAAEILYIEGEFSRDQMSQLYRSCDVFVSSYRGEGFCLPAVEAMSSGLPVIVTHGGATDDFADEDVGWLIEAEKCAVKKVFGQQLDKDAFLLEPNRDHLVSILRKAYNSPAEVVQKGIKGALRARKYWTWKHSVCRLLSRIDALCGTTMRIDAQKSLSDSGIDAAFIESAISQRHEHD
jgi:glycosyltransferase involved in cell wall biosynthesis